MAPARGLHCRFHHILNKYSVASCRIVHQHMGHCAHQFTILDDGAAGHE